MTETTTTTTSTQLRHPWRTTLRTIVWYTLAALAAISVGLPVIADAMGVYLSPRAVQVMGWTAGLAGALLATVQRLVLLQPIADVIARLGLGTGQADAYVPEHAETDGGI